MLCNSETLSATLTTRLSYHRPIDSTNLHDTFVSHHVPPSLHSLLPQRNALALPRGPELFSSWSSTSTVSFIKDSVFCLCLFTTQPTFLQDSGQALLCLGRCFHASESHAFSRDWTPLEFLKDTRVRMRSTSSVWTSHWCRLAQEGIVMLMGCACSAEGHFHRGLTVDRTSSSKG